MNNEECKKLKIKQYYKNKYKNNLLINKYIHKRNKDIIYKIIDNLSKRANNILKKSRNMTHMKLINKLRLFRFPLGNSAELCSAFGFTEPSDSEIFEALLRKLIGCDASYLKKYLESKFLNNMSYNNYGEWEIDHIKPISSYNLNDIEQVKECFNYKNLQPLWKIDNLKKYNKY